MNEQVDQPRQEGWMSAKEQQFRREARNHLTRAASLGLLSVGREIKQAKIFGTGISSVVYLVEGEKGSSVAKMTRTSVLKSEACFLEKWHNQGVRVPRVYGLHLPDQKLPVHLLEMEFINAPLLSEQSGPVGLEIARKIGQISATIHRAKGEQYGYPRPEDPQKGEFLTLKEAVENDILRPGRVNPLLEAGIITDDDLEIAQKAVLILQQEIDRQNLLPSLIHSDLGPGNILVDGGHLVVIDPDPYITHPFYCLGITLTKFKGEEREAVINGYQEISGRINQETLAATIVLGTLKKLRGKFLRQDLNGISKLQQELKAAKKIFS